MPAPVVAMARGPIAVVITVCTCLAMMLLHARSAHAVFFPPGTAASAGSSDVVLLYLDSRSLQQSQDSEWVMDEDKVQ